MPLLTRDPPPFNDAPGLPSSRHLVPGAAGFFLRLPKEKQESITTAQRRDPYNNAGYVALAGEMHARNIEGATIELTIAAIEADEGQTE